jgi:hypothetical protein
MRMWTCVNVNGLLVDVLFRNFGRNIIISRQRKRMRERSVLSNDVVVCRDYVASESGE